MGGGGGVIVRLILHTTITDLLILRWLCSDGKSTHIDCNTHRRRDYQSLECHRNIHMYTRINNSRPQSMCHLLSTTLVPAQVHKHKSEHVRGKEPWT